MNTVVVVLLKRLMSTKTHKERKTKDKGMSKERRGQWTGQKSKKIQNHKKFKNTRSRVYKNREKLCHLGALSPAQEHTLGRSRRIHCARK